MPLESKRAKVATVAVTKVTFDPAHPPARMAIAKQNSIAGKELPTSANSNCVHSNASKVQKHDGAR
jgi:hypothetical protein